MKEKKYLIKNYKQMFTVIAVFTLMLLVGGVTYAFFNYTRTGSANTVRTGTINFTSSQTRINLSNVFPIATSAVSTDTDNVGTATITVTGDTTYDKGIEYLISATNVTNTVGTKNIPISISTTASGTLGTSDEDYFDNRDTSTNHIYKVLAKDTISNDDQLMVGYIAKGQAGINGTITIKAYIDKDKILISDTYPEGEQIIDGVTYYNGTPTTNKTVLTTTEWNSLNTNGISFQVKVEANEGTWVLNKDRNDMTHFTYSNSFSNEQKSSITEINFIKMNLDEINSHANLIDLTANGGQGVVKGWIDNDKLYIASPGTTYFPLDSSNLFYGLNVQAINFNNINTSNVANMNLMFSSLKKLENLDLSRFNTKSVTNMSYMFVGSSSLSSLDLSNFDTSNVIKMESMFQGCSNLTSLDLSSWNTANVNNTWIMFANDSNLTTIYVGNDWNISNASSTDYMFASCTSLVGGNGTAYDSTKTDKTMAVIDTPSTPGYLTLKQS